MMCLEGRALSRPTQEKATTERGPPLFQHSIIPLKVYLRMKPTTAVIISAAVSLVTFASVAQGVASVEFKTSDTNLQALVSAAELVAPNVMFEFNGKLQEVRKVPFFQPF